MTPNRLVALAIIALFALGYARLLIDAGVRDEVPAEAPTLDLITRAACTAIAEPLGEVLGVVLNPDAVRLADAAVGCSLSAPLSRVRTTEVRRGTEEVFRLLQWTPISPASSDTISYLRHPIRCEARFDSGLDLICHQVDVL